MVTKIKTVGLRAVNSPHCFAAKCHPYVMLRLQIGAYPM